MTLASATTAGGSEIGKHFVLVYPERFATFRNRGGQPKKDLSPDVVRKIRLSPWQEESGRPPVPSNE
jgi:hypothetical protein